MQAHIDKINEMASVMKKAIEVDEGHLCEDEERIKQLEVKALDIYNINLFCLWKKRSDSTIVDSTMILLYVLLKNLEGTFICNQKHKPQSSWSLWTIDEPFWISL